MPERLSIGADVVEAAMGAYRAAVGSATYSGEAMEAAIREALDKLGLREERQLDRPGYMTGTVGQRRYVTNWEEIPAGETPSASVRVDSEPSEPDA
jgi:hypothetical protein